MKKSGLSSRKKGKHKLPIFKSQEVSLIGHTYDKEKPVKKNKKAKLKNKLNSNTNFRPLLSSRSSRVDLFKKSKYSAKNVRKIPMFSFIKNSSLNLFELIQRKEEVIQGEFIRKF